MSLGLGISKASFKVAKKAAKNDAKNAAKKAAGAAAEPAPRTGVRPANGHQAGGLVGALRQSYQDLLRPLEALRLVAPRELPTDPAHVLFDVPIEQAIAHARALLSEFETTREVSFAMVYRLEVAYSTLSRNMESNRPELAGLTRGRLRNALLQVVHLAQVGREWQQDVYNLQHTLYYDAPQGPERAAVEAGIARLKQFIEQNMTDLTKWLRAAERLSLG